MHPFIGTEAVAAGLLTRRQLDSAAWRRLFPNVYAPAGLALDHRIRCVAAGLYLGGRGVVSGRSAAALWGADLTTASEPVEVTVGRRVRLRVATGLRVVRSNLPAGDVTRLAGLPVTSAVRTAFDLGRRSPHVEAVVAVDALLNRRLFTVADLRAVAAARSTWPGCVQLESVLRRADGGAESPMETRLRLLLVDGGLPAPVTQFEVCDAAGSFVARLDMAYPAQQLGIEYDGDHHRDRGQFRRDLGRVNALRACGWTVLRFVAADVYREPDKVLATVRRAGGSVVDFPRLGASGTWIFDH